MPQSQPSMPIMPAPNQAKAVKSFVVVARHGEADHQQRPGDAGGAAPDDVAQRRAGEREHHLRDVEDHRPEDRLRRRQVELLDHEGGQEEGDAPVAAGVRHVEQPADGDALAGAGNGPDALARASRAVVRRGRGRSRRQRLEARRLVAAGAPPHPPRRRPRRKEARPAPAVGRHHDQGHDRRQDEADGEQREHDAAGAERAVFLRPDLGRVRCADG